MIIVLEGVDGTGKTHLARELAGRLGAKQWKSPFTHAELYASGHMTPMASKYMDASVLKALECAENDVIVDRFFPSGYAYDKAFGREFDEDFMWQMDGELAVMSHLCVLLSFRNASHFMEVRDGRDNGREKDKFVDEETWEKIDHAYHEYTLRSSCKWVEVEAQAPIGQIVASVMRHVTSARPNLDSHYMSIARAVSKRSTCLSRRNGAVLVSASGHVIATAYNGAPAGLPHQRYCHRLEGQCAASGSALDECTDVHSEENLIVQAALSGSDPAGGTVYSMNSPCPRCARMLINARISRVVYSNLYSQPGLDMLDGAGVECVGGYT